MIWLHIADYVLGLRKLAISRDQVDRRQSRHCTRKPILGMMMLQAMYGRGMKLSGPLAR